MGGIMSEITQKRFDELKKLRKEQNLTDEEFNQLLIKEWPDIDKQFDEMLKKLEGDMLHFERGSRR